ncbi:MAG: SynChlorMet cassette protein ScmD [Syntrophales bacterium]
MTIDHRPVVNPMIVLRKEFDDWAVLFDPDSGEAFGINPVGVFIWERLDGRHTLEDIAQDLKENADGIPEDLMNQIEEFVQLLIDRGLAGYEIG